MEKITALWNNNTSRLAVNIGLIAQVESGSEGGDGLLTLPKTHDILGSSSWAGKSSGSSLGKSKMTLQAYDLVVIPISGMQIS